MRPPDPGDRYAGYPSTVVYAEPDGKTPIQHLLWGDWMQLTGETRDKWVEVRIRRSTRPMPDGVTVRESERDARPRSLTRGWVREAGIRKDRILEIVFVDIGQGDGCLVVTPDDRHLLVDAGEGDNMFRFLRWRYGGFRRECRFAAAVITHPDQDHYQGFAPIFDQQNFSVDAVYHNGIVERVGDEPLGPSSDGAGERVLTDVVTDPERLRELLSDARVRGRKRYPNLLWKALQRFPEIRMLCAEDRFLPGFEEGALRIEVLGPVSEPRAPGEPRRLRWFRRERKPDVGYTKNGHSIVLKLTYGKVSVFLGGDLNIPAEHWLLSHYCGGAVDEQTDGDAAQAIVEAARKVFRCDVAKACHHGSADFSDLMLRALDPVATVISSGDDEPHSHPRADSLGGVGRWSRGRRPLIFSTELARSARELIKYPHKVREQLLQELDSAQDALTEEERAAARQAFSALLSRNIDRSVAVYGAINLRTDGTNVVLAQKIEKPRTLDRKWDIYRLEPGDPGGELVYVSKHGQTGR